MRLFYELRQNATELRPDRNPDIITNADRIRAMSDEELSDIFLRADFCKYCEHEKDGVCNYICAYKTVENGKFLIGEIVAITKTKKQTLVKIRVEHNVSWKRPTRRYPASAIGKTVFLTRAEAEAALRREQDEKGGEPE